jgi:hypothetical protein
MSIIIIIVPFILIFLTFFSVEFFADSATINCGRAVNICKGTERDDTLIGNASKNTIDGLGSSDDIVGLFGDDILKEGMERTC